MDVPIFQVNFIGEPYSEEYVFPCCGGEEPITDPNVLVSKVVELLNNQDRYREELEKQKSLKNKILKNFGSCSKIIAETIVDICNKKDEEIYK